MTFSVGRACLGMIDKGWETHPMRTSCTIDGIAGATAFWLATTRTI